MAWTNVSKPAGTALTWDQATMSWVSASFSWAGGAVVYTNIAKPTTLFWTNLSKPSAGYYTIRAGMATGLIMPPTYAVTRTVGAGAWTNVSKPI